MDQNSNSRFFRMSVTIVAVMSACVGLVNVPQSHGAGNWPNEPAGFSVLLDCPFSDFLCPPLWNAYNTQDYTTINSAPYSPGRVFDSFLAAGSSQGNGQWGLNLPDAKEVFIGAWWSTNADFVGMCNNANKMWFVRRPGIDNSFLIWYRQPVFNSSGEIFWANQTAYSNAAVSGWSGDASGLSGGFPPNIDAARATVRPASGWHKIELLLKTSTTTTSRDGRIRIWIDGVLTSDIQNVNQSPGGFQEFQINHTWDGSSCLVPPNRDMSKAWHHYWDHMRIAVGQGTAASDQPPGPPAAPGIRSVTSP